MGGAGLSLAIVVAAAGLGTRLDSGLPKQYVPLLGIPMLQRTLSALSSCAEVDAIVVAVNPEDVEYCEREIRFESIQKVVAVAPGGEARALSVRNGLQALRTKGVWDLVGVHDGARPLVTCGEISRAVAALAADPRLDGAVPAIPCVDTIKVVDEDRIIVETPARHTLWQAQTPQVFRWEVLFAAYSRPENELLAHTDDAALVEACGGRLAVVEGSPENFKVTDRMDLRRAEHVLADRRR